MGAVADKTGCSAPNSHRTIAAVVAAGPCRNPAHNFGDRRVVGDCIVAAEGGNGVVMMAPYAWSSARTEVLWHFHMRAVEAADKASNRSLS